MGSREDIDMNRLPQHVAVIMDGNGRWAKEKGKMRLIGHQNGVLALRNVVEGAAEIGLPYLTVYAFSMENWNRPKLEVIALMELMVATINKETKTLMENGVRLNAIGDLTQLPDKCFRQLRETMDKTKDNTACTLTLALSYSSRWELVEAARQLAIDVEKGVLKASDIDEKAFISKLTTAEMPDPELMIRTSGEYRVSNYLLWQLAYSELYFTDKHWPDFRKEDLFDAIADFQKRERRFGKTSEQVN